MISVVSLHPRIGEIHIEHAPNRGAGDHARLKFGGDDATATVFLQSSQVAELQRLCAEYLEARREVPMFASRAGKADGE